MVDGCVILLGSVDAKRSDHVISIMRYTSVGLLISQRLILPQIPPHSINRFGKSLPLPICLFPFLHSPHILTLPSSLPLFPVVVHFLLLLFLLLLLLFRLFLHPISSPPAVLSCSSKCHPLCYSLLSHSTSVWLWGSR